MRTRIILVALTLAGIALAFALFRTQQRSAHTALDQATRLVYLSNQWQQAETSLLAAKTANRDLAEAMQKARDEIDQLRAERQAVTAQAAAREAMLEAQQAKIGELVRLEDARMTQLTTPPQIAPEGISRGGTWLPYESPTAAVLPDLTMPLAASSPARLGVEFDKFRLVPVLYGTERRPVVRDINEWEAARRQSVNPSEAVYYGNEQGPLEVGLCQVSIPRDHESGRLERPSLLQGELEEDRDRHFTLTRLTPLARPEFVQQADRYLAKLGRGAVVVFVHGYNVKFNHAVMRAAQLAHDWDYPGLLMVYSWASEGKLQGYWRDQKAVARSTTAFLEFLEDVVARTRATNVSIVAHSMGNRLVTEALSTLGARGSGRRFQEVVFAAPDVRKEEFVQRLLPALLPTARRFTLYACDNDVALLASMMVDRRRPRLGLAGRFLVISPGLQTIDASKVTNVDMLHHSYMTDGRPMIEDLARLLTGADPEQRCWLEPESGPRGTFWHLPNKVIPCP